MSFDDRLLADALRLSAADLREIETADAVRTGYACPAPACGLRYRHTHDGVWWPPEGEPWPPRRAEQPEGSDRDV